MKMRQGIALAALLSTVAGISHAQSSVTLYGVADVGVEYLTNVPSATGGENQLRMSSGNMSTSRWGLRSTEDLGGGLKAIFELESGISIDTGSNNSSKMFDRGAYVGLSGGFGAITLGRQTTPLYDTAILLDPMGFAPRYSLFRSDDVIAGRADNSIKYKGTFAGLTASGLYSFGRTNAGEIPGQTKVDRSFGGSLSYANGPLMVGVVYDQYQGTSILTRDQKDRRALAGASYMVGPVKAFAGYRWLKGNVGVGTEIRSDLYWLGLRYHATTALSFAGAGYYTDFKDTNADPMVFVASADYAFSKRTDAYFNVGYARNKNSSQLGLNGYNASTGAPTNVMPGENQTGVVLGLRHKF